MVLLVFISSLIAVYGFYFVMTDKQSGIVVFIMSLFAATAMLMQTLKNKSKNKEKYYFYSKLITVIIFYVFSIVNLLKRFI